MWGQKPLGGEGLHFKDPEATADKAYLLSGLLILISCCIKNIHDGDLLCSTL